jgi:MSHA biogenesis protein MshK
MKQSQVSSLKFQVGAAAVAAVNFKLQTSNFKLSALILALGAAMAVMATSGLAWAQITTDPTRPATGFAAEAPEGAAAGNQLQSVMISPTQSAAIINGVRVRLGEKYGDAVLVRVAESEVVLRSGNEQQVLKLFPGVEKREIVPVALAAPAPAPAPAAKSAPRKAKAKTRRDAKPPADDDAPAGQGARP